MEAQPDNSIGFGVTKMSYSKAQLQEAFQTLKWCRNDKFHAVENILWADNGDFGDKAVRLNLCTVVSWMHDLISEFPDKDFDAAIALWNERLSKDSVHIHDRITKFTDQP